MSIKAKTKAFVVQKNISYTDLAIQKDTTKQQISRTYSRDNIKLKELLELCVMTDCRIAIIDNRNDNEIISYNKYDIE